MNDIPPSSIKGYTIIEKIGSGSMGTVYKAYDNVLKRNVALKVLNASFLDHEIVKKRFLIEARTVANLIHPNIVLIYHIDDNQKTPYFAMEWIDGLDLGKTYQKKPEIIRQQYISIIEQILEGVSFAHETGIIHRDLKLENILINEKQQIKIVDFGLAKIFEKGEPLTSHGELLGSPQYISPEQIEGTECSFQSDIYSLGVVFYFLFSGKFPYKAKTPSEWLYQHLKAKPLPLSFNNNTLPEEIKKIILKMLEKDPAKRYKNIQTIQNDFQKLSIHSTPQIKTSGPQIKQLKTSTKKLYLILPLLILSVFFSFHFRTKIKNFITLGKTGPPSISQEKPTLRFQAFERERAGQPETDFGFAVIGETEISKEQVSEGQYSLKHLTKDLWGDAFIFPSKTFIQNSSTIEKFDRFSFFIYSIPVKASNNNIGITFYDDKLFFNGFTVWTTCDAFYKKWTEIHIPFCQLPENFNLKHLTQIKFTQYWPGIYYLDNLTFISGKTLYQTFETAKLHKDETSYSPAWPWDENDTCRLSLPEEPVYEGKHSLKLTIQKEWDGVGIASETKKYIKNEKGEDWQSPWHVDANPLKNDRLTFWIYALPAKLTDQHVGVQFFDHGQHSNSKSSVFCWTKERAIYNSWTKMTIPFKKLPPTFNLKDLNKIELQFRYPGTYFIDFLAFTNLKEENNSNS